MKKLCCTALFTMTFFCTNFGSTASRSDESEKNQAIDPNEIMKPCRGDTTLHDRARSSVREEDDPYSVSEIGNIQLIKNWAGSKDLSSFLRVNKNDLSSLHVAAYYDNADFLQAVFEKYNVEYFNKIDVEIRGMFTSKDKAGNTFLSAIAYVRRHNNQTECFAFVFQKKYRTFLRYCIDDTCLELLGVKSLDEALALKGAPYAEPSVSEVLLGYAAAPLNMVSSWWWSSGKT